LVSDRARTIAVALTRNPAQSQQVTSGTLHQAKMSTCRQINFKWSKQQVLHIF